MPQFPLGTVLQHIRQLAITSRFQEQSDAELLDRFVRERDERAFAELLRRHGRLVWSACRQALRHEHDAEDAFQATFLVLARNAASIRRGQAVASWLYNVAHRIAAKAGVRRLKRQARERQAIFMARNESGTHLAWRELQEVLNEELERLPEKYRAPFVLCCLEGKSQREAAVALGWKQGTVSGRLWQGRKLLQSRLKRRGMMLSAVLCATTLAREAVAAPAALVRTTLATAVLSSGDAAADVASAHVTALVEEAARTLFGSKTKIATMLLVAVSIVAGGFGLLVHQALAARPGEKIADASTPPLVSDDMVAKVTDAVADANKNINEEPIVLKGRVLGPEGQPVAAARVRLLDAEVRSDEDGKYCVSLPRPAGEKGPVTRASRSWWMIAATADGYGADFRAIGTAGGDGNLDLHLVKDDVPIEGRILDLDGRPVAGAAIRVTRLSASEDGSLDNFLRAWKSAPLEATGAVVQPIPRQTPGGLAAGTAEYRLALTSVPQWRTWWGYWAWNPIQPVTTDQDGKFRLSGVGRERFVEIAITAPTLQFAQLRVVTRTGIDLRDLNTPDMPFVKRDGPRGGPVIQPVAVPLPTILGSAFEQKIRPTKPVTGVVRDKETGNAVAGARIIGRVVSDDVTMTSDIDAVTDENGRYRLTGLPKTQSYSIWAAPAAGSRYLPQLCELKDTEGLKPLDADFELAHGVKLRGRLIDKATGKPAAGTVRYALLPDNAQFANVGRPGCPLQQCIAQPQTVKDDGSFEMTVFPGKGVVWANADDGHYLPLLIAPDDENRGLHWRHLLASRDGVFIQGHAYGLIEPGKSETSLALDLELMSGRTLSGTVVGPDGEPVVGARAMIATFPESALVYNYPGAMPSFRSMNDTAEFTIENIDPRRRILLAVSQSEKKLAGLVLVQGDEKTPIIARLQPTGKVTGRVLDAAGQPVANATIAAYLGKIHGQYTSMPSGVAPGRTDNEGRFTVDGIMSNAGYILVVLIDNTEQLWRPIHQVDGLIVESGQARDLGDIKTGFKPE